MKESKDYSERPKLARGLASGHFKGYYYLKEELVDFCRQQGLQTTGSKEQLTDRIAYFLDTGEKKCTTVSGSKKKVPSGSITKESVIEADFVCSEQHRAFFKEAIGKAFSFNVAFQKWLKAHAGHTYEEAIKAYECIQSEKKKDKTPIDKQFEYNTYIRDFFHDNKGKTLEEAIQCWRYKKAQKGDHHYEPSDLKALDAAENEKA